MKNGFWHERPNDYDIEVAPHMVSTAGAHSINWHIAFVFYSADGTLSRAVVDWKEQYYLAERQDQGADHYWTIVAEVSSEDVLEFQKRRNWRYVCDTSRFSTAVK